MSNWIFWPLMVVAYICCGTITNMVMVYKMNDDMSTTDGEVALVLSIWPLIAFYSLIRTPLSIPAKIIRGYKRRLQDKRYRESNNELSAKEYQAKIKQLEKELADALLLTGNQ